MSTNKSSPRTRLAVALSLLTGLTTACGSEEAPRVAMPVGMNPSAATVPIKTDLGYTVTLTSARAALRDLEFTVGGETHMSLLERVGNWLVPAAHAHPGHAGGGEITGELTGAWVVDWLKAGAPLGTATLVVGKYQGANFTFRTAQASELPAGDPLIGNSFVFAGTASKDGRSVDVTAVVQIAGDPQLIGAPFDYQVTAGSTAMLGLRFLPTDPTDRTDTIWNQIDFFTLDGAATGSVRIAPGQDVHNVLVRALRIHDHYDITHP